ncbi:hypothetical protein [Mangrovimonas sp. TPBH4]|uniref:hypothetical protein n=1 Tax=Mangrovimonas sp. TPBH4 TaxID=1645914 RepID=UPI0006B4676B|nr:hypothetical protein [Mangrovimonas sp. TPBH4]
MEMWSYIGIGVVLLVALRFVRQLGKTIPILELMLLIAGLQWIVGPLIEYASPSLHYKYFMYVPQEQYMAFVAPAFGVFAAIILLRLKRVKGEYIKVENLKYYSKYGLTIFAIGVVFDLIGGFLPGTLGFFAFILSNFKFAGAIILYFSENKRLKNIFYGAIAYLFLMALAKAMFHDFILWSVFFFMFWALKFKPKVKAILLIFALGAFFLITLQTIKTAYRAQVWSGYSGNKVELFFSLMVDTIMNSEEDAPQSPTEPDNNVRLNQGWIISAVLNHIPINQQFLEGATISEAVYSSVLPRFLNPNKKEAGGQENFRVFTGLEISSGTSMGISIVGEAYGNYGVSGGIMFMGLWGLFLAQMWLLFIKKIDSNLILIAFIPLIFLQVIKAETELVVVLNHFVKSSIVVFLFFWFVKKQWKWVLVHESDS